MLERFPHVDERPHRLLKSAGCDKPTGTQGRNKSSNGAQALASLRHHFAESKIESLRICAAHQWSVAGVGATAQRLASCSLSFETGGTRFEAPTAPFLLKASLHVARGRNCTWRAQPCKMRCSVRRETPLPFIYPRYGHPHRRWGAPVFGFCNSSDKHLTLRDSPQVARHLA